MVVVEKPSTRLVGREEENAANTRRDDAADEMFFIFVFLLSEGDADDADT